MHKKVIHTHDAPAAIGPYSQAIAAHNLLFISGQLPVDPGTGEVVAGGAKEQALQSLANLLAILKASGTDVHAVVKTTVFLKDLADFQIVNEVYAGVFTKDYPARACVQVAKLPKDVLVEVEAIAILEN
ncbi:RidA family protein [Sporomusa sp. GT1]|uniref:RidA family protein n=1 Tax=Sporomusa sp. GT1 TaxID=1534747 RepID=UPI00166E1EF7|nr:RidA family protein [Sporomusa sp. GT1]